MSNLYYATKQKAIVPLVDGVNESFNVDGSGTPVNFDYTPGATEIFEVTRVVLIMFTSGNIARPERFMSLNTPLTNGIEFSYSQDAATDTLLDVKTNFDLIRFLDATYALSIGNDDACRASIELNQEIILDGTKGDFFRLKVQDDLSTLGLCGCTLQGRKSEA